MTAAQCRPAPRGLSAGLFLDRDGTLVHDYGYMGDPSLLTLLPGAREAIDLLRAKFRLYLVTNQSGIARGYYTLDDARRCTSRLEELLGLERGFDGVCIAPELPGAPSRYRKPSPAYLLEAIRRDGLSAADSFMVGDRVSDLECGLSANVTPILIPSPASGDAEAFARAHGMAVHTSLLEWARQLIQGGTP